jgi:cbb3-type cytochrome oxidase maturation protein
MDILYLLIPLSIVLVFAAGAAFWWALGSGQFEDLEGPAHRILTDDDDPGASEAKRRSNDDSAIGRIRR